MFLQKASEVHIIREVQYRETAAIKGMRKSGGMPLLETMRLCTISVRFSGSRGKTMKAVWCHDSWFKYGSDNQVYSIGPLSYDSWRPYFESFNDLTVIGREYKSDSEQLECKYNVVSGPKVAFALISNFSNVRGLVFKRADAIRRLTAVIGDADVVIARLPSNIGGLAAGIAHRLGKPLAVEVVSCVWDALWNYGTWQGKICAPVMMRQTKRAILKAPFALYVTQEFLQRRYPTRGIAAAVSDVNVPPVSPDILGHRLAQIENNFKPMIFGLIGCIKHRYKGIQTAFEALSLIRPSLPEFEFRILGGGEARPWQEEAARWNLDGYVRFCGTVPSGQAVFDWLDCVDVYLQPSFQEGLPRALIEAMSRGCPAIASTAGGIPELLSPECLHRPGDGLTLSRLLLHAARDATWRLSQARRNFEVAAEYQAPILQKRRSAFWTRFAASANSRMEHWNGLSAANRSAHVP